MADVQTEKGYAKVANELLEALARTSLSDRESRLVFAIMRKTYGFHKTWDKVAYSQLTQMTGIDKSNLSRLFTRLTKRRILERRSLGEYKGYKVRVQKDYDQWVKGDNSGQGGQQLSIPTTVDESDEQQLPEPDEQQLSTETTTKDSIKDKTKDTSRSIPMTELISSFIDDWNTIITSTRISRVKQITAGKRLTSLKARLKDDFFLEYYRAAMKKINTDYWANYGHGERSWSATVSWFTRPGIVEEIMEWGPRRQIGDSDEKDVDYSDTQPGL